MVRTPSRQRWSASSMPDRASGCKTYPHRWSETGTGPTEYSLRLCQRRRPAQTRLCVRSCLTIPRDACCSTPTISEWRQEFRHTRRRAEARDSARRWRTCRACVSLCVRSSLMCTSRITLTPATSADRRRWRDGRGRTYRDVSPAHRFTKAELTAERVLDEMRRVAFADIRTLFDVRGNLEPVQEFGPAVHAPFSCAPARPSGFCNSGSREERTRDRHRSRQCAPPE